MYEKEKSTLLEQVWLLIRAGRLREVSGHGALGAGTPLFMPSCGRAVLLSHLLVCAVHACSVLNALVKISSDKMTTPLPSFAHFS